MWTQGYTCYSINIEVKGQLVGVSFLFPLCGFLGLSSGHQALEQELTPTDPFC